MMLPLLLAVLTIASLLWALLLWKRESRRLGITLPRSSLLVALLVPLLAAGLYMGFGFDEETPGWLQDRAVLAGLADDLIDGKAPEGLSEDITPGAIARVLQNRLHRTPTAEGWYALGLLYSEMEVPALAAESARRAVARDGSQLEPRMLLAQSLIEEAEGRLTGEARRQLEHVLAERPRHDGAWMLLGMSAANSGDYALAIEAWESLLSRHADSQAGPLLRRSLDFARGQQQAQRRFRTLGATIEGPDVRPGGTLFIALRKAGEGGQPLAARRVLAERFPLDVSLRDQDWLQAFPDEEADLVLSARYSPSASAGVDDSPWRAGPVPWQPGEQVELLLER